MVTVVCLSVCLSVYLSVCLRHRPSNLLSEYHLNCFSTQNGECHVGPTSEILGCPNGCRHALREKPFSFTQSGIEAQRDIGQSKPRWNQPLLAPTSCAEVEGAAKDHGRACKGTHYTPNTHLLHCSVYSCSSPSLLNHWLQRPNAKLTTTN